MTQEEREATNAALLLDEMIEERIWQAIEKGRWKVEGIILQELRDLQHNPEFSNIIATALRNRL